MDTAEPEDSLRVARPTALVTLAAVLRNPAMRRALAAFGLFGTAEMANRSGWTSWSARRSQT